MIVVGTEVDHIRPISQGGPEDDESNLQLLCKACHAAKTARE
jgi:5-methylcytosine-specific restriction protein A